jgi:hypothetical protein
MRPPFFRRLAYPVLTDPQKSIEFFLQKTAVCALISMSCWRRKRIDWHVIVGHEQTDRRPGIALVQRPPYDPLKIQKIEVAFKH